MPRTDARGCDVGSFGGGQRAVDSAGGGEDVSCGFNAGDNAKAAALASPSGLVIVDEFAPHLWTGKSAFATWSADFDKDAKAKGITEPMVTMDAPLVNTISGDVAYLVCPMTYIYKQKGVPMREPARMAMVLRKEGAVWRFLS